MIGVDRPHLHISGGTSTGLVREKNEDRFTYAFYRVSETDSTPILLAVVADGVGGEKAGEAAASIAVDVIPDQMLTDDISHPLHSLEEAFLAANREIVRQADTDQSRNGMACTCVCALVIGKRLYIANVGDSRIYLWRKDHLSQISRDHTWANEAASLGLPGGKEISRKKPLGHVITRYLGSALPPKVDLGFHLPQTDGDTEELINQGVELDEDALVLLCSDGLTDMLSDPEIEAIIRNNKTEVLVEKLTDAALRKGGEDNITLVIIGGQVK